MSVRERFKDSLKWAAQTARLAAVNGFRGTEDVALTFDDGPHPVFTPQVLDILQRHGAKATFFVLGEQAARYPELLARMVADGHAIANHTWDHPACLFASKDTLRQQVRDTERVLNQAGPGLFRAPFGLWDLSTAVVLRQLHLTLVGWTWESDDHLDQPADVLAARIANTPAGSIVLMHDRLARARAVSTFDRRSMLAGLDQGLARLRRRSRTVSALIAEAPSIHDRRLFPYSRDDRERMRLEIANLMQPPAEADAPASINPTPKITTLPLS